MSGTAGKSFDVRPEEHFSSVFPGIVPGVARDPVYHAEVLGTSCRLKTFIEVQEVVARPV